LSTQNKALKNDSDLVVDPVDKTSSLKTLFTAVITGLVFWASLFALLFFCLTS